MFTNHGDKCKIIKHQQYHVYLKWLAIEFKRIKLSCRFNNNFNSDECHNRTKDYQTHIQSWLCHRNRYVDILFPLIKLNYWSIILNSWVRRKQHYCHHKLKCNIKTKYNQLAIFNLVKCQLNFVWEKQCTSKVFHSKYQGLQRQEKIDELGDNISVSVYHRSFLTIRNNLELLCVYYCIAKVNKWITKRKSH